jgi:hypothetical protein
MNNIRGKLLTLIDFYKGYTKFYNEYTKDKKFTSKIDLIAHMNHCSNKYKQTKNLTENAAP